MTVCRFGHKHETFCAAQRCTRSRRRGEIETIKLGHRIQRSLRKLTPEEAEDFLARNSSAARLDPFRGFRERP